MLAQAGWDVDARRPARARRRSASSPAASATSRSTARCGCSGSAPLRSSSSRPTVRAGCGADALREVLRGLGRPDDRLRPGRQREHRRVRPARRDRGRVREPPAPGSTSTARSASGRPPSPRFRHLVEGMRARRLLGDRRAQVAERPVRLRHRLLPRTRRRTAPRWPSPRATSSAPTAASPSDWVPESSRRARGFAVWAALRSLGRSGVAELVDRCCATRARFAELLGARAGRRDPERRRAQPGARPLRRRRRRRRARSSARVQADGTCWLGGTDWQGRAAMRISVSSFRTTSEDVERSARRRS